VRSQGCGSRLSSISRAGISISWLMRGRVPYGTRRSAWKGFWVLKVDCPAIGSVRSTRIELRSTAYMTAGDSVKDIAFSLSDTSASCNANIA
jgi:hypothetical protein